MTHTGHYRDALAYLQLTMHDGVAERIVNDLTLAPERYFLAKDIFLASQREPTSNQDYFVWDACENMRFGLEPDPILIYRTAGKAVICAGWAYLCAAYHSDKYAQVKVKVV
jgi:hypothetical protein